METRYVKNNDRFEFSNLVNHDNSITKIRRSYSLLYKKPIYKQYRKMIFEISKKIEKTFGKEMEYVFK